MLADLALVTLAALVGAGVAQRLHLPTVLGYLAAGLAIGPFTLGLVSDVERVRSLAEMGVIFLLFALGVEFPLAELRRVLKVALIGGSVQIIATIGIGMLLGLAAGLDQVSSLFFGSLIALSSTMVVLKVLTERGEVESTYGRILVGMLIVQDLSVVPLTVVLPALAAPGVDLASALAVALLKAAILLIATVVLGVRLVPPVLVRVASLRSRELFLLATLALALGTAVGTYSIGLSLAFGAFLAGVIVSESELAHQVLAEMLPLKDTFSILFFVAIGMLLDPSALVFRPELVAASVVAVAVVKPLIGVAALAALGYSMRIALPAGIGLGQIGEFSFVLAQMGLGQGMISYGVYSLILAVALVTILLTPPAMGRAHSVLALIRRLPIARRLVEERPTVVAPPGMAPHRWHAVICGFGDMGRILAEALERRDFSYLVIDEDPLAVQELRRLGIPAIYGDATSPVILEKADLGHTRVLAVVIPDPLAASVIVRQARRLAPRLHIIARAPHLEALALLRDSGADEVVHPQFEAGLEIIRYTLQRFGVPSVEALALVNRLREEHYSRE